MLFPGIVIREHRLTSGARRRTETVAQQVNAGSEGGKFLATAIDLGFRFHKFAKGQNRLR